MMAERSRLVMVRVSFIMLASALTLAGAPSLARAGLDEYVKKPDSSFAWSQTASLNTPGGTITTLALTSQVWQGITWKHELTVYEPRELNHADAMLLFITGGDHKSKQNDNDHKQGFMLAQLCGARIAVLRQVPNQPLLGDKKEDELIAETFVRYLQTKDENWPLLFPMTKSAVRAMDALQAFTKEKGRQVQRFVVTGGSKRGWTTWLTGAVDDRVVAIAPMVIVMLNSEKQGPNQIKVWGKYSEQIGDYVERVDGEDRYARGNQALEDGRPVHVPRPVDQAQALDQRHQRPLLDARRTGFLLERAQGAEIPGRDSQRRPRPGRQPRLGPGGTGSVLPPRHHRSSHAKTHVGPGPWSGG